MIQTIGPRTEQAIKEFKFLAMHNYCDRCYLKPSGYVRYKHKHLKPSEHNTEEMTALCYDCYLLESVKDALWDFGMKAVIAVVIMAILGWIIHTIL